jgi:hypothetical protein
VLDMDLFVLQIWVATCPASEISAILPLVLSSFGSGKLLAGSGPSCVQLQPEEIVPAADALHLLATIFRESSIWKPSSSAERLRAEVVHLLAYGPATYSAISEQLSNEAGKEMLESVSLLVSYLQFFFLAGPNARLPIARVYIFAQFMVADFVSGGRLQTSRTDKTRSLIHKQGME